MLLPLNLMQSVFFQSKYRILHGFITPNNFFAYSKCFMGICLIAFINIFNCYNMNFLQESRLYLAFLYQNIFDLAFYSLSGIAVFVTNVKHCKNNVELILKMQQTSRILHCSNVLEICCKWNWFHVIIIFLFYFVYGIVGFYYRLQFIKSLLKLFCWLYFDVNIIFATRIIMFLEYELKLCTKELGDLNNESNKLKDKSDFNFRAKQLFRAYLNIQKAFDICDGLLQISVRLRIL